MDEFAPPPVEQRAQDHAVLCADRGKAANPAAAIEPHDDRFKLVVGVMRGHDMVERIRLAPLFEQAWGDASTRRMRWPLFVHAFRKPGFKG